MTERVLLVDDEPNVLNALRRQLRKQFDLHFAEGGTEALAVLEKNGPFALVVSDMQMPDVTGLDLLQHVSDKSPDTIRIMLTGNADQKTAVDAVNQGNIFRFLSKPCSSEELATAISAGLEQHRLIIAERQLLSETLNGSIELLNDVLGLTNPKAFGRAHRLRKLVKCFGEQVPESAKWQLEAAAGFSQIGWVTVPNDIIEKRNRGQDLTASEQSMVDEIPKFSSQFVRRIPRLEPVSQIIEFQSVLAKQDEKIACDDPDICQSAKILDLILTFDELSERVDRDEVLKAIKMDDRFSEESEWLDILTNAASDTAATGLLSVFELQEDMVLDQDVFTKNGMLIVRQGQTISPSLIVRLKNYDANQGVAQPIRVLVR